MTSQMSCWVNQSVESENLDSFSTLSLPDKITWRLQL